MSNIFKLKNIIMKPLIKLIINRPELMKSKIFMSAMKAFPSKISEHYDEKIKESKDLHLKLINKGLENVEFYPKLILDICTGTGVNALFLADKYQNSKVYALDLSEEMIEITKDKAANSGLNNLKAVVDNALNMGFESDKFDLVFTSNAPIYLHEISRVIKDNCMFIAIFSFAGDLFLELKPNIAAMLEENNFSLEKIQTLDKGVVISARKK
ncbi:MAG: class I SAM-dependent methyltransferase [Clostridia bacterium]